MQVRRWMSITLWLIVSGASQTHASIGGWEGCSGRLERALDALHRESSRRIRIDDEDAGIIYQQELRSAPLEMSVSRIAVKLPQDLRVRGSPWAHVDRCIYEPNSNSLETRLVFNDLSVSGLVSLLPRDYRAPIPAESCRMTLRLRRAGIEFYTSPIARGRGQMRIRTESSFLEPRFASIYAYGCRPTRLDKQIKRQDKWPPQQPLNTQHTDDDELTVVPVSPSDNYEAAEPRELVGASKEVDVAIANESRQVRALYMPEARLGLWKKNDWITRPSTRTKRSTKDITSDLDIEPDTKTYQAESTRSRRSVEDITPRDFALALAKKARSLLIDNQNTSQVVNGNLDSSISLHEKDPPSTKSNNVDDHVYLKAESITNYKRETTETPIQENPGETRELLLEEDIDEVPLAALESEGRGWQSREGVAREMEDVFLRGASQALTSYIERQLHPAIKETLMLSMGYTISYG
ncbi:uncharacterized protein LOC107267836 [Cephus cinctus]|uniref:Uncharacterized protein LOC107267836 n=1 Tax=Cephus cinctus TaxID=211228 RepID=A0AAJ7RHE0_CEPCN|nr:uncharacterized protein LOC107267836 [Cephus cinctus]XP_024940946.1 uncharacterized protein LOC107267836 [Cephus cinctus]